MSITRAGLERQFKAWKIRIVHNVGGRGKWSVETDEGSPLGWGTLGLADNLLEAESVILDKIELHHELHREAQAEDGAAQNS